VHKYANRRDNSEIAIVDALEAAGVFVYRLNEPVDLLCWFRGAWVLLECKSPRPTREGGRYKGSASQQAFCKAFDVPVVSTPEQAIAAIHEAHERLQAQPQGTGNVIDFTVVARRE
jgi:hypothetical protein